MSKKDVLHIPTPETPAPRRTGRSEGEEHPSHAPPLRPSEGPGGTPGRSGEPRIISPQPSSIPYPGVGVS